MKLETISAIQGVDINEVLTVSSRLREKLELGGKVLVCGNGGSLTDGSHFVGELLGRYKKKDAKSLPAILLSTGGATGSAISNDYGYQNVFSRQIEGLGSKGDFLICLSTSGDSENIANAINYSISKEIDTLFLTSINFKKEIVNNYLSIIKINSKYTPAIQQAHMYIMHQICEFIDESR